MLLTVMLGSCVLVQGELVRRLSGGRVRVRVGDRTFVGKPIGRRGMTKG